MRVPEFVLFNKSFQFFCKHFDPEPVWMEGNFAMPRKAKRIGISAFSWRTVFSGSSWSAAPIAPCSRMIDKTFMPFV
jgi:hypothetical protein